MLVFRALSFSLLVLSLLAPVRAQEHQEIPRPSGWVNDFAKVIDTGASLRLQAICKEVDDKTHAQIAVVTIDSTPGVPVADYARSLFNKWGIGHKEDNRGMLILLSIKDRQYRIEVGSGLETLFPNERAAKIGAEMVRDLQRRHFTEAAGHGVREIASIIAKERGVTLKSLAPIALPAKTRESGDGSH